MVSAFLNSTRSVALARCHDLPLSTGITSRSISNMAAELDLRAISAFSSVPEANISSLLDNPTADLVRSLLVGIESKVKEYEQNKTQKVKLEVELETVVRTGESKAKVLQNSRDNALADSSKLRADLQKSG